MSKQGQFLRVSVDTCLLASYCYKSVGRVVRIKVTSKAFGYRQKN